MLQRTTPIRSNRIDQTMKHVNVVIIDDDELCIKALKDGIAAHACFIVKGEALSASAGRKQILDIHPQLLFLDVELPNITGMELLQELHHQITWPMQVVFYTAYNNYILKAIHSEAFDYLLKPHTQEELNRVVNRFLEYDKREAQNPLRTNLHSGSPPKGAAFMVSTVTGYKVLHLEQIGYFTYQKERKQWMAILDDQSHLLLKRNTKAINILNYSTSFLQINQQQIINTDYLSIIQDRRCVLFPPFNNAHDLCISRNFYGTLHEHFSIL